MKWNRKRSESKYLKGMFVHCQLKWSQNQGTHLEGGWCHENFGPGKKVDHPAHFFRPKSGPHPPNTIRLISNVLCTWMSS